MIATRKKCIRSQSAWEARKATGLKQTLLSNCSSATSLPESSSRWASPFVDSQSRPSRGDSLTLSFPVSKTSAVSKLVPRLIPEPSSEPSTYGVRPDALTLYMRKVGEVALLTPAEETALARRVQDGDEQAREHMILANLRLVVKIAREYENISVPLLDLINEGNIGLIKAVERFDPDKGAKLSTYSAWWIKNQIRLALAYQGKTIRIPINAVDKIHHLRRAEAKLQEILGREASDVELADELGLSVGRVAQLREAGIRPSSLDAPLGDEHSSNLAELVADENAVNPAQRTDDNDAIGQIRDLIARLSKREAKIIRARFGLDDGRKCTLETIGAKLGVSRERIRQLQDSALAKLRRMVEQPETSAAVT